MKIDFPCPASSSELTPTEKGDYCSYCDKEVVDIDRLSTAELENLDMSSGEVCVSTSNPNVISSTYSIRKFALSLLIVFGGALFRFADAQIEDKINSMQVEKSMEASIAMMQVVFVDQDGDTLSTSVDVTVELPNGKELKPILAEDDTYWVELPAYVKGKSITIKADRFGKTKTRTVYVYSVGENLVEEIRFKVKRMKYKGPRYMGCPAF